MEKSTNVNVCNYCRPCPQDAAAISNRSETGEIISPVKRCFHDRACPSCETRSVNVQEEGVDERIQRLHKEGVPMCAYCEDFAGGYRSSRYTDVGGGTIYAADTFGDVCPGCEEDYR